MDMEYLKENRNKNCHKWDKVESRTRFQSVVLTATKVWLFSRENWRHLGFLSLLGYHPREQLLKRQLFVFLSGKGCACSFALSVTGAPQNLPSRPHEFQSPHSPSPFLHLYQTFRSNIEKYDCFQCSLTMIVRVLYSVRPPLMTDNIYILLDLLVCSIAVYFYESCSILASPKGKSKYKWWVFGFPKFWLAKVFNLSRGRGNETSTNIVWYL